jgi:pimeloyl-ACP methyl ester carboxylesterase
MRALKFAKTLPGSRVSWSSIKVSLSLALLISGCAPAPTQTPTAAPTEAVGNIIDDVSFQSGDITLVGRLDLPEGDGPFPAIVWVHGSGRSTRTEAQRLTNLLTANGFAVLRYDKRGVGQSGGRYTNISPGNSIEQLGLLAQDAAAAVDFAASRPEIDTLHIGLFGSSQAGWIIPQAANLTENAKLAVILVGPAVSVGVENMYSNLTNENSATITDERLAELSNELAAFHSTPGFDPRESIAAMSIPALWVLGLRDASIPTVETAAILEEIRAAGGHDFDIHVYPNGTHSLADWQTNEQIPFMEELVIPWFAGQA